MNGLQTLVTQSPTGATMLDVSPWAQGAHFGGDEHGFTVFTCTVPMLLKNQFWFYDRPGLPHLAVNWNGLRLWEGRIEDVAITNEGLRLTAFGYQRALGDAPYTGLWSYSRVDRFRPVTAQDSATRAPEKYAMDTNNRLFIGLRKNETYANANEVGDYTMAAPNTNSQDIYRVEFDYTMLLPANWTLALQSFAYDFTSFTSEWSLAATGILQTGSVTQNLAANKGRINFRIVNATGAPYNWAGETGANYARITNLKVKGTTSATLYANEIVNEFIGYINSLNSAQLSSDTGQVVSPAVELRDELYEDADIRETLDRLALVGNSSGQLYEWGVWDNRQLVFRVRGSQARTWYADISAIEIERTLDTLRNSVYAKYQEAAGATLRTANNADAFSVARYGLTRRAALETRTTSSTQAQTQRDAYLTDRRTPIPRVGIQIDRIYDAAGQPYPVFLLRANDTLVARNLSPALSTDIDRLRRFRVTEYDYDVDARLMEVIPEAPLPTLDVLLNRQAATA